MNIFRLSLNESSVDAQISAMGATQGAAQTADTGAENAYNYMCTKRMLTMFFLCGVALCLYVLILIFVARLYEIRCTKNGEQSLYSSPPSSLFFKFFSCNYCHHPKAYITSWCLQCVGILDISVFRANRRGVNTIILDKASRNSCTLLLSYHLF